MTTTTSESGHYGFTGIEPHESYCLEVAAAGYCSAWVGNLLVRRSGVHLERAIELRRGGSLAGLVRDEAGAGIPDVTLLLHPCPNQGLPILFGESERLGGISDAEGNYEVENIPPGTYWANVPSWQDLGTSTAAFTISECESVRLDLIRQRVDSVPEQSNLPLVVIETGEPIGGRVLDGNSDPIAGAEVLAENLRTSIHEYRERTKTDDDGAFRFKWIPRGWYRITVGAPGFEASELMWVRNGSVDLTMTLEPATEIAGKVVAEKARAEVAGKVLAEIAGARRSLPLFAVRLHEVDPEYQWTDPVGEERLFTNDDARFVLHAPGSGDYVVQASAPGYATSYSDQFTIAAEKPVPEVVVSLSRGGTIRGTAVDVNGKRIPCPLLIAQDLYFTNPISARAPVPAVRGNGNGEFNFRNLRPGVYRVALEAEGYSSTMLEGIDVREGVETIIGETILVRGGTIRGTVRDSRGNAISQSSVLLSGHDSADGWGSYQVTYSNEKGQYLFARVHPGSYTLIPDDEDDDGDDGTLGGYPFGRPASWREIRVYDGEEHRVELRLGS